MNIYEFLREYGTKKQCEDFFIELRWGSKDAITCPHCNCNKIYPMKHRIPFKCSKCKKLFSVKPNTVLAKSNIPLQKWALAVYILTTAKKGISSVKLAERIGVTQKTTWFVAHRVREMYTDKPILKDTIEMDETFIREKEKNKHENKKLKQGRDSTGKVAVMGAMAREEKQVVAYPVPSITHNTVSVFINKNVKNDNVVFADEATAYDRHTMLRVNHGKRQYVNGNIHINSMESFWATIKRGYVGIYHWWSKKHLLRYINEFAFRYNNKNIQGIRHALSGAIRKQLSYKQLVRR